MRYTTVQDGEEFVLRRRDRIACCDCGLVHDVIVKIRRGKIYMRVMRNKRATTVIRKSRRYKCRSSTR